MGILALILLVSVPQIEKKNGNNQQQAHDNCSCLFAALQQAIDALHFLPDIFEPGLDRPGARPHLFYVHRMEEAVKRVARVEELAPQVFNVDAHSMKLPQPLFQRGNPVIGLGEGQSDFSGPLESMAAGAGIGIDQLERSAFHSVAAVTRDALRSA